MIPHFWHPHSKFQRYIPFWSILEDAVNAARPEPKLRLRHRLPHLFLRQLLVGQGQIQDSSVAASMAFYDCQLVSLPCFGILCQITAQLHQRPSDTMEETRTKLNPGSLHNLLGYLIWWSWLDFLTEDSSLQTDLTWFDQDGSSCEVITPIGMAAFSGFAQPGSPDQMRLGRSVWQRLRAQNPQIKPERSESRVWNSRFR